MNANQFLLLKLAEECAEVAQRASKQIQFGKHEAQNDQSFTNGERLKREILDLYAMVRILQSVGEIPEISAVDEIYATIDKKKKLQRYLDLSASLGQLPEIKL